MADGCIERLSVTQIDQSKPERAAKHYVVRLNVGMGQVEVCVEVIYCRPELLDKVSL
jgi:hypothetical protein